MPASPFVTTVFENVSATVYEEEPTVQPNGVQERQGGALPRERLPDEARRPEQADVRESARPHQQGRCLDRVRERRRDRLRGGTHSHRRTTLKTVWAKVFNEVAPTTFNEIVRETKLNARSETVFGTVLATVIGVAVRVAFVNVSGMVRQVEPTAFR